MPTVPALAELYAEGVTFRRSQLVMIAGRPASQKSGFAMALAAAWDVPVLYMAADLGEYVATVRDGSICTGMTSWEVSEILDDPLRKPQLVADMKAKSNIRFSFDSMPSLQDIDEEVEAFVECFDEYPAAIFIDNLLDLEPVNESEFASHKQLLLELKALARTTGACVVVIHHTREESDPRYPASARTVSGKVTQSAEIVLSVALDGSIFRVAVVKNRTGSASPMADRFVELIVDPARTSFRAKTFYIRAVPGWQ